MNCTVRMPALTSVFAEIARSGGIVGDATEQHVFALEAVPARQFGINLHHGGVIFTTKPHAGSLGKEAMGRGGDGKVDRSACPRFQHDTEVFTRSSTAECGL